MSLVHEPGRWTPAEDDFIRELYPTHSSAEMAARLRCSVGDIWNRCWHLGIKGKQPPWTTEEIVKLKAVYSAKGLRRCERRRGDCQRADGAVGGFDPRHALCVWCVSFTS